MPRFVILEHVISPGSDRTDHFDLMFEREGVLKTWMLPVWPIVAEHTLEIEELPDHRLAYLEYEGAISGDRGHVRRVEQGSYELIRAEAGAWIVQLQGDQCTGRLTLQEISGALQRWRMSWIAA